MPKQPRSLDAACLDDLRWAIDRSRGKGRSYEQRLLAVVAHHTEKRTLAEIAQKHGVTKRAVSKWVAAFQQGRIAALKPKPRKGKPARLTDSDQHALTEFLSAQTTATELETRQWLGMRLQREVPRSFARYWKGVIFKKLGVPRRKRLRVRRPDQGFRAELGA
ncbi:MAG: helix-turn-helix domain-containing protein [Undibacterium sp.]|nr:helix-turn-helix domain-containing protein [Opitutaceae bacterium]